MNSEEKNTLVVFISLLVVLGIALLVTGTLEYQDEVQSQETYCDMVKAGNWPDYEGTYHDFCERSDDEP